MRTTKDPMYYSCITCPPCVAALCLEKVTEIDRGRDGDREKLKTDRDRKRQTDD